MTRTALATSTAGLALLTLTGCVSLGPGESQAMPHTAATASEEDVREETQDRGESLAHPLEDAEVFEELLAAAEDLESLRMEITLSFELDAPWISQEQSVEMTSEATEDFSEGHVTASVAEQGRTVESVEAYFHEGGLLENVDGQGWTDSSSPDGTLEDEADSRYTRVMEGVAEIEDLLTVDYDDETYALTYSGSDAEAFDAFEEPFSLSLDGYAPEETDMTVEVTVDPQTFYAQDFTFTLHTQDSPDPIGLGMEIEAEYSKFDEIPPLEIPEDVFEEAFGPQD